MAKLVVHTEKLSNGGYGIRRTNRAGDQVITVPAGVEMLDEDTAVAVLQQSDGARGSLYQAVASLVAQNFGSIVAGLKIDPDTPKTTSKAVSERIDTMLEGKGVKASGRGSSAGQYRSIIARYIASGSKLEPDSKGMLPSQKVVQAVDVQRTAEEIVGAIGKRIKGAFTSADDEGVTEDLLVWLEANGIRCEIVGAPKTVDGTARRIADEPLQIAG